jgi:hypothetical protein
MLSKFLSQIQSFIKSFQQADLDHFIRSHNPKSEADVEMLIRKYNRQNYGSFF